MSSFQVLDGRKEGRKKHVYLTIRQYTILIYWTQRIVRRLSIRLNKAASATAKEIFRGNMFTPGVCVKLMISIYRRYLFIKRCCD